MLPPSNLDLFAFEDESFSQNDFEPTLPSPPPHLTIGDFLSTFPSDMLLDVPALQAEKQNALLPLPAGPGAPSIQPRAPAIPPANGVRICHEEVTGGELCVTGDKHSSTPAVPATLPVRFTPCLFRNLLI